MKTRGLIFLVCLALLGSVLGPQELDAQELHQEQQAILKGKVLEVISSEERRIPGTDTEHVFQSIRAKILEGDRKGEVITIENDYLEMQVGDKFYFSYIVDISGAEQYGIINIDRKGSLLLLASIFVLVVLAFGGKQGVRSLIALLGSFLAIFYILMPGLLNGWNPLFASLLVASGVLFAAIFFTHGFNRESAVAYAGTIAAVLITGAFAIFAVNISNLTGFGADESIYLNFNTRGMLDFTSLLLGAIIIGVLGVLDDIAVTQAAVVSEFYDSNKEITRREVYNRAIRVGREHVGALVNTLVLAYTGAALPLLLYLYTSPTGFSTAINLEIIATEIVRMIVGSIGLILTVPIVTALAVFYLKGYKSKHSHHVHSH